MQHRSKTILTKKAKLQKKIEPNGRKTAKNLPICAVLSRKFCKVKKLPGIADAAIKNRLELLTRLLKNCKLPENSRR